MKSILDLPKEKRYKILMKWGITEEEYRNDLERYKEISKNFQQIEMPEDMPDHVIKKFTDPPQVRVIDDHDEQD